MSRHQHHHHNPHNEHNKPKKKLHQSRVFLVAVILMLIAMGVYVLTMDESVVPADSGEPPIALPSEN
ncbi:MAG: hypothetical protein WEB60_10940 [Terrimicrobiaceae bacterium]